jgi:dipicolinate synthase subunit A
VVDLASKPGGVDFEAARELGIKTVHALSLPGIWAPETAAAAIKEAVCNILEEEL